MAIKKQYLKSKPVCKTKFVFPEEAAKSAKTVHIVGDFNDWDVNASPMKRLKNGSFTIVMDLPVGKEYQYRYLMDGTTWENDWDADKYVPNPYGDGDNSVVIVQSRVE